MVPQCLPDRVRYPVNLMYPPTFRVRFPIAFHATHGRVFKKSKKTITKTLMSIPCLVHMTETGRWLCGQRIPGRASADRFRSLGRYEFTVEGGRMDSIFGTRKQAVTSLLLKLGPARHPEGMLCKGHYPYYNE
ncbi:UNVERIFIED_CONTAM: hypothetical protein ABIC26_001965 [Paenibacillus sp. PvR008]